MPDMLALLCCMHVLQGYVIVRQTRKAACRDRLLQEIDFELLQEVNGHDSK